MIKAKDKRRLVKVVLFLIFMILICAIYVIYNFYTWRFNGLEKRSTYYNDYIIIDGNASTDILDIIQIDLEASLPYTLKRFKEDKGLIVVSDNMVEHGTFYISSKIDENTIGFYKSLKGRPIIWIDAKTFDYGLAPENIISHEMAHYLDDIYKFSSSKELKDYYNKYAIDYKPKINVDDGYQAYNKKEYFACLFTDYARTSKNFSMSEDVYIYMSEVFEQVENINKLKNR